MFRKAFMMKVYPDQQQEYEKRHKEIWPEMVEELRKHGVKSYSIFLNTKTSELYGYIEIEDEELWSEMAETAINQKWWEYMSPVMETHPDHRPVSFDLQEVFHLE
ncbi:L-rhamnose mutarotase [Halobacillus shinanisalinarum]|uniref:L-rhamnose mutarotase n=1 Tax=Halobacillus shinanisalinarum TaxID=2932258 RepID=A0ABY4H303_9BACI|nr:L-rhamnose mutarotase [Halobacillus shinanisalinarum]UOQ93352.1 L-rhamnose mutarotase [Halobacillus shinanisalinarum]